MNNKRCIALFSGGLDSLLACEIMIRQSIDVIPVNFNTGFFFDSYEIKNGELFYKEKVPDYLKIKVIDISQEFFEMIKSPEFGFGRNANPCIDCKILMLKKAKELLKNYDAGFVITGEVLGQRPMTQNINSMKLIEEKSGLSGFLLRPLCAKRLPETEPEKLKWVDREKLLSITGRSRKQQLKLADEFGLTPYIKTPAGGCLLTDPGYSKRLIDFLKYEKNLDFNNAYLLKTGRHFRINNKKFIIGRNKQENEKLLKFKREKNVFIFDTVDVPGPVGFAGENLTEEEKKFIASAVARYSDGKENNKVRIKVINESKEEIIEIEPAKDEILKEYII